MAQRYHVNLFPVNHGDNGYAMGGRTLRDEDIAIHTDKDRFPVFVLRVIVGTDVAPGAVKPPDAGTTFLRVDSFEIYGTLYGLPVRHLYLRGPRDAWVWIDISEVPHEVSLVGADVVMGYDNLPRN